MREDGPAKTGRRKKGDPSTAVRRTGTRWLVPSAQAMLDLRAVHASDQWARFQAYRIDAEGRRLYPDQRLLDAAWPAAA